VYPVRGFKDSNFPTSLTMIGAYLNYVQEVPYIYEFRLVDSSTSVLSTVSFLSNRAELKPRTKIV